jgi:hypothetical protein
VATILGVIALFMGIAFGILPLGTYASRIMEQANPLGYLSCLMAAVLISARLTAALMGWSPVEDDRWIRREGTARLMASGPRLPLAHLRRMRPGRTYARVYAMVAACLVIGAVLGANVWRDLFTGPATARGIVSAAYGADEQAEDSHGNPYTKTTYYVTIDGLQFSSSNAGMAHVYARAVVGTCAVVSYGRYSHLLVDLTPCAAR